MFSKYSSGIHGYIQKLVSWTDPYWWIWVSICLFILFAIHFFPLVLPDDNHNFKDRFFLYFRRLALLGFFALGIIYPLLLYVAFGVTSHEPAYASSSIFKDWCWDMLTSYWPAPLAGIIGGLAANICWHRYGESYLSNLGRMLRVKQKEDRQSDIRNEATKLKSKNFNPEDYFKDGYYFLGLDENDQPIYMAIEEFHKVHSGLIAPTQFGKGVEAGVILTQSVRFGNTVFCIDPKTDKNLPYILQNEAARAGRPFVYLDLNPDGKGHWHPFKGGVLRDRRSRLIAAFKLERGGTTADVYKSKERGHVDKLLNETDGSIRAMLEALGPLTDGEDLSELRDSLREWSHISTFMAPKKKEGHSIEKSLLNNAVVYIRGSITDDVVKLATRCYIAELVQEARRLDKERTHHLTMFVDEIRFVVSNQLVDGMATITDCKTNMILATQAISDLLNVQDKTINGPALQQSFEVNCQVKFIYKAGDDKTAEWAEKLGGTQWLRMARNEKTEVNRWGAEKWDKSRAFDQVEAPLISQNKLLSLPPRVAILYRPNAVAQPLFTCWVNVNKSVSSWEKKDSAEDRAQQELTEKSTVAAV